MRCKMRNDFIPLECTYIYGLRYVNQTNLSLQRQILLIPIWKERFDPHPFGGAGRDDEEGALVFTFNIILCIKTRVLTIQFQSLINMIWWWWPGQILSNFQTRYKRQKFLSSHSCSSKSLRASMVITWYYHGQQLQIHRSRYDDKLW